MNILFVVDTYNDEKNGTTVTARRMARELSERGHQVRILAAGDEDSNSQSEIQLYALPEWKIPIVQTFAKKQNFTFAHAVDEVVDEALTGTDIVHFLLPLPMEKKVLGRTQELGIPHTAAFHLQPENITFNVGMGWNEKLAEYLYSNFYDYFYQYFTHIHCPSQFIADQLARNGYTRTAKLHVLSNGVDASFAPIEPDAERRRKYWEARGFSGDQFHLMMCGRLSPEKNQKTILEAIDFSPNKDHYCVHFAGQGPDQERLKKQAERLGIRATFNYYPQQDLQELLHNIDLYIHSSIIEIEAISCLEAIASGNVPVIANSERSATPQFALDERSLFRVEDPEDLAAKADYWFSHPLELRAMRQVYSDSAQNYRLDRSVDKIELMFEEAIEEFASDQASGAAGGAASGAAGGSASRKTIRKSAADRQQ